MLHNIILPYRKVLISLILIIALVLRLLHIQQPYVDIAGWRQCSVAMIAENYYKNWNILYPEVNWDGTGPSYNGREFQTVTYISAGLYTIFGQQDWIGRMVAVIFGVWGIFALYQLVRRVGDERHALAAALIMALLPESIFVERSFLPDPAMVSLVTTSMWMLIPYLQSNGKTYLLLFIITGCLGFLTKITGMLVILPMIFAVLEVYKLPNKSNWKKYLTLIAASIIMIIPVAAWYLWARYISLHYPPYHFAGSDNWLWDEGLKSWITQKYFLNDLFYILKEWAWGIPIICLFIMGFVFSPSKTMKELSLQNNFGNSIKPTRLFHFWLVACVVFYLIGAKEIVWNFWNLHIFSPVVAAFAGRGLVILGTLKTSRPLVLVMIVSIIVVIVFSGRNTLRNVYSSEHYSNDYRMGMALRELKKPGNLVVVIGHEVGNPIAIFYSRCHGWAFRPTETKGWEKLPTNDKENIHTLGELRLKGADWLGIVDEQYRDIETHHPVLVSHISANYKLEVQTKDFVIFRMNE